MDSLVIGSYTIGSRLIMGTGRFQDYAVTAKALVASGARAVTVAVRRMNLSHDNGPTLTDYICPRTYRYVPNTAGCYTADEAVKTLCLAREAGGWTLVKLEVIGDKKTLYPNMQETFKAVRVLIKEGFEVMVYCNDDPVAACALEEMGCVAIMPMGAPIGSGLGIRNPLMIGLIKASVKVPVLIDAGLGTASDAVVSMELGCDGVICNTAIAQASNPVVMAKAMARGVEAGRLAYLAGRMKKTLASPSSPLRGLVE